MFIFVHILYKTYLLINTLSYFTDKWEIDASEITLLEELGSGQFGVSKNSTAYFINKIFF